MRLIIAAECASSRLVLISDFSNTAFLLPCTPPSRRRAFSPRQCGMIPFQPPLKPRDDARGGALPASSPQVSSRRRPLRSRKQLAMPPSRAGYAFWLPRLLSAIIGFMGRSPRHYDAGGFASALTMIISTYRDGHDHLIVSSQLGGGLCAFGAPMMTAHDSHCRRCHFMPHGDGLRHADAASFTTIFEALPQAKR